MTHEVLVIAASDSSGGAGIQRDQRTLEGLGLSCVWALTGITAQGKAGVSYAKSASAADLSAQLAEVRQEELKAVKLGALFNAVQIRVIGSFLSGLENVPVIIDPVFCPSKGVGRQASFLDRPLVPVFSRSLLPFCSLLCPNLEELPILEKAAPVRQLARKYNTHIFIKGGHSPKKGPLTETLIYPDGTETGFEKEKLEFSDSHGTGCAFASAAAGFIARHYSIGHAVREASVLVSEIFENRKPGIRISRAKQNDVYP